MHWTLQLIFLTLVGCGGGGLTFDQLDAAKALATPLKPKADTRSAIIEALGQPTGENDASTWWQATTPDCKQLTITWMGTLTGTANLSDC
jgi:hypothetical protein